MSNYFDIPIKHPPLNLGTSLSEARDKPLPPLLSLEDLPRTPMTESSQEYIRHCVPTFLDPSVERTKEFIDAHPILYPEAEAKSLEPRVRHNPNPRTALWDV